MSITVSITELLQAVGSENIRFQSLSTAMEKASLKNGVTVISFATDAISPTDFVMGGGPSGIVVWVDQQLLRERLEELKQGNHVTYGKLLQQRDELLAALEQASSRKLFTCSGCGAEGLDEPLETKCHCCEDGAHWIESELFTVVPKPEGGST